METHVSVVRDKTEGLSEELEPPSSGSTRFHAFPGDGLAVAPTFFFPTPQTQGFRSRPIGTRTAFRLSPRTRAFMRRYFPGVTPAEWNDWRWQLSHRLTGMESIERIVSLTDDERNAITFNAGHLPLSITPYYASLIDAADPAQAIRRSVVPVTAEFIRAPGEADDPLGEDADTPVPGLVHRYPDRVLFLVTGFCSNYCRYCTRSRMVGKHGPLGFDRAQCEQAIDYIERTPAIRDVLLSGGDPLTLTDETLDWLLGRLRRIPHVEIIRIGTKVPAVLPQRITRGLVSVLRRHHPLWMNIHFTHPDELTPETREAVARLADAGIPLGSQTVLLKGMNDSVATLKELYHGLLTMRVRPYYLYQCDPISGSSHFRTPVSAGIDIIDGLRGHTTGFAVPNFVIDAPGGGGKIPLLPDYYQGRDGDDVVLRNYEGGQYRYTDTAGCGQSACSTTPGVPDGL